MKAEKTQFVENTDPRGGSSAELRYPPKTIMNNTNKTFKISKCIFHDSLGRTRIGYGQIENPSSRNITWTSQIYFKYTLKNDRNGQKTTAAGREKVHNIDQFQVEHLSTNPYYSFEHFPTFKYISSRKLQLQEEK